MEGERGGLLFCDQGLERGRYQVRDPAEVEQGLATAGEHANALRAVARVRLPSLCSLSLYLNMFTIESSQMVAPGVQACSFYKRDLFRRVSAHPASVFLKHRKMLAKSSLQLLLASLYFPD